MRRVKHFRTAVRDSALIAAGCVAVSLIFNALRSNGIPLVRTEEYNLLVPCPETMGEVESLAATPSLLRDEDLLIVDARSGEDFNQWHVPGAVNVPYDYLMETPARSVEAIAASGAARVAVIGDGGVPDSGEQLARELSGRGIRNVGFIVGGIRAAQSVWKKGEHP